MKKNLIKAALFMLASITITITGCDKNEKNVINDVTPMSPSKNQVIHNISLVWADGNDICRYDGYLGSPKYNKYRNNVFEGAYTNLDSSSVVLTETDDGYAVYYSSMSTSGVRFSITDIETGVYDTVMFKFKVNDEVVKEFVMYGGYGFLSAVLSDIVSADNNSEPRTVPNYRFFPNGTAKLIGDISLYYINSGDLQNIDNSDHAFWCRYKMSCHLNQCQESYSGNGDKHISFHYNPTHVGCYLYCCGRPVAL